MSLELSVLLRVTAIFVVTAMAAFALRQASAATRHTVWSVGFLAALILPFGLAALPIIKLPLLPPAPIEAVSSFSPPAAAFGTEVSPPQFATEVASPSSPDTIPLSTATPMPRATTWGLLRLLRWIWGIGSLIAFIRLLFSNWEVLRLRGRSPADLPEDIRDEVEELKRELSIKTPVDIRLESHDVPPMTCGLLRQTILLPAAAVQWVAERRQVVLAHELGHVRRHDGLIQIFVEIVCALYWFHPAVWLAGRRLRLERERACDDAVLSLGVDAENYVDHLLILAREINSRFSPGAVSMAHPRQLESRLRAILDSAANRRTPSQLVRALLVATGVLLAAGVSSVELTAIAQAKVSAPQTGRSAEIAAAVPSASQAVPTVQRPDSGSIGGQLRNADGTPAVAVRVAAMVVNTAADTNATLAGFAETDSTGRYRIDRIPPGAYYVTAGLVDSPTFYPGVKTPAEARSLGVTAGATVENIDFTLVRPVGFRVAGRVQNLPPGLPREAVRVSLQPVVAGVGTAAASRVEVGLRSDDTFEFTRVAPGRYVPSFLILDQFGAADPIVVDDRDLTVINITPPPLLVGHVQIEGGGTLPGPSSVLAAAGPTHAGSFVQILSRRVNPRRFPNSANMEPGNGTSTTVRASGLFVLQADAGEYQVNVTTIPVGYYLKAVSAGNVDLMKNSLLIATTPPDDMRVVLTTQRPADAPPEVKLSGKLTGFPSGTAPSTRSITFTMSAPAAEGSIAPAIRRVGEAQIHDDGTFELLRVSPGSWSITVLDREARISSRAQTIFVGDRDVADIEIASQTTGLTTTPRAPVVASPAGVKLSGRVIPPNSSTPLPNAVTAIGPGGGRTASVQPDGSFSFPDMPPGTVTLRTPGGYPYGLASRTVSVADRDLSGVQILLPQLFDIRGRFTLDGSTTLPSELSRLQLSAQYRDGNSSGQRNSIPQGGLIAMELPAGTYNMSVLNLPATYTVESITYGNVDLRATPLTVGAPLTSEIVVRIAPFAPRGTAPKVAGHVTNLPAAPYIQIPKIILTRDTNAGGGALETPMSKDGSFTFNAVPPGPYSVTTFGLTADFTRKLDVKDSDITDLTLPLAGLADPVIVGASFAAVFTTASEITLRGVITQTVTHPRPNAPVAYIRMEVTDASGEPKSWAVVLPRNIPPEQAAEIAKLKIGARVVVVGNPARDGSNRVGPSTALGIEVLPD